MAHGIIYKRHKNMLKKSWIIAAAATFSLAGCLESDLERGAVGAATGAVVGDAIGIDPVAGAAAGVAAGLLCDDAGICRASR